MIFEYFYLEFKGVIKELIWYKCDDGVELSGMFYLLLGYDVI